MGHRYFVLNKPYRMVSQFVSSHKVGLLGDLDFDFPEGTHAVGRLDNLSEGLLILTTDKRVTRLLFQSKVPHKRTYLVRVSHVVTEEKLEQLRAGVSIQVGEGAYYTTLPCEAEIVPNPENLHPTQMDLRPYSVHTWLRITLREGKFHQVRKMVWTIGHPCKRLIRTSIEDLKLNDMQPGQVIEIEEGEFFRLLKIDPD